MDGFADVSEIATGLNKECRKANEKVTQKGKRKIDKMYFTGHSLGSYLAAFIATDIMMGALDLV